MTEESLFHEALARTDPTERASFLDSACASRPDLRAAVEALLAAHEQSGELLPVSTRVAASPAGDTPAGEGDTPGQLRSAESTGAQFDPDGTAAGLATRSHADQGATAAYAQAVADEAPPARIGRYEIRQRLGRGGMGTVFLAHDPQLDRPVALKVPRLAGRHAVERFLREARAAAAVDHPNLCPVYDAGQADGIPYLAMAYAPGPTLTEVIKRDGPLPPARAAAVAAAVARGMAEAHRHGIVHRDLKPGNILFDRRGEPVVTDFGLAFRAQTADLPADANTGPADGDRLTQVGAVMGTPAYMPPEQAHGALDRIGPASDVYSLGAILFEMLAGRPPYRGANVHELLDRISHDPVPAVAADRADVPAGLDAICRQALAKVPGERFASMDEFAAALAPFASGPPRRRRWGVAVAAVLLGLLLVASGVVIYVRTDHGDVEVRLTDPAAKVTATVDGEEVVLTDGGRVTRIRPGPHTLVVTGPDFQTETRTFRVTRGGNTVVEVELKPRAPAPVPLVPPHEDERAKLARILDRGRRELDQGRIEQMGKSADEALKIDPESPTGLALRAVARGADGRTEAALEDANRAVKLNPELWVARMARGMILGEDDRNAEAIADETIAIRLAPAEPRPWTNRANSFLNVKEYRQAVSDATRGLDLGQGGPDALMNRAGARVCLGEYDQALADYAAAEKRAAADPRIFDQRSALHAKMGNKAKERADSATARRLNPKLTPVDRVKFPDPPKAVERKKLTPDERAAVDRLTRQAGEALARSDAAGCRTAAEEAVRIDPTASDAHALLARVLAQLRQFDAAEAAAAETLRLDPDNAWAYTVRGGVKTDRKQYHAAVADHTVALRLDDKNYVAWNNRSNAYALLGEYHQALYDIEQCIRLKPDFAHAYSNRAGVLLRFGEYRRALADYRVVAAAQPKNPRWRLYCALLCAKLGDAEGEARERAAAEAIDPKMKDAAYPDLPAVLPPVKKDPEAAASEDARRRRLAEILAAGRKRIEEGSYTELAPLVEEGIALDPESPGMLSFRATLRFQRRQFAEARADAEAALRLNPETPQALVVRGSSSGSVGKIDDAIADYTAALQLDPNNPGILSLRAFAYLNRKDYRQVVADATRAIDLGHRRDDPYANRATAYAFLGEYDKAVDDYTAAVRRVPSPNLYIQRSAVYAKMGKAEQAEADWQEAKKLDKTLTEERRLVLPDPPKPVERKRLTPEQVDEVARLLKAAQAAYAKGDLAGAREPLKAAAQIDPTDAVVRMWRARAAGDDNLDEAVAEANEALRLDPTLGFPYVTRGLARVNRDDVAGGMADLTIAVTRLPDDPMAWNDRGWGYLKREMYHQAVADLSRSIRLNPNFALAYLNRGWAYVRLGEYDRALADHEMAVKLRPLHGEAWLIVAALRLKNGDSAGAAKARDTAMRLNDKLKDQPDVILPVPLPPSKKDPAAPGEPDGTK